MGLFITSDTVEPSPILGTTEIADLPPQASAIIEITDTSTAIEVPETKDTSPIAIDVNVSEGVANTIDESAKDISPIEVLDLNHTTPTEDIIKNHEPLAARISAFLKELQELKNSDEITRTKLEEELKQIQADEKKIDDTIILLNNIKNV